jgi:hypothetical protein
MKLLDIHARYTERQGGLLTVSHSNASGSTELPEKAPHFLTEVAFDLLPEVIYDDIVYLSQIVKAKGTQREYDGLRDALRKIQWAKLAALEAIEIERDIAAQMKPGTVPFVPVGQARHAKAMMECITHSKAALDSMAVFLSQASFTWVSQEANVTSDANISERR